MRTRFNKRAVCGVAVAASMLLAGAAQAALQDRELNGDTVVDAFYDTDLDITWLRDADVNGIMHSYDAVAWADGYSFGGHSDWRLPASDTCFGANCIGSEMGHLWHIDLGNTAAGPITNAGGFLNLQALQINGNLGYYWSGTDDIADPSFAYVFAMYSGLQGSFFKLGLQWAMAVHPGDIGSPVPEPESLVLMLAGLAVLAGAAHRRRG